MKRAVWKKKHRYCEKNVKKGIYSEEEIAELTGLELMDVEKLK